MFIAWIVKNCGFLFLALAAVVTVAAFISAGISRARAAREEAEQARQQAEREAAKRAEKAAKDAAKEAEQIRKQAEREAAKQARQAAQAARAEKRLEQARQLAEYRERALEAARQLRELEAEQPARNTPAPAAPAPVVKSSARPDPAQDNAPKPFTGQAVSFTGRMRSMNRAQAADMVRRAGGKAFIKEMPVGTTLLVVGDTRGENTRKLDKADEWIGQTRKITEAQFLDMLTPVMKGV